MYGTKAKSNKIEQEMLQKTLLERGATLMVKWVTTSLKEDSSHSKW
jgi:hypothetical protein